MRRIIKTMSTGAVAFILLLPNLSLTSELTGGLKIGMNSADLYGDDLGELEEYEKSKIVFCGGGFITWNINEMFAIQPEVLYTKKGENYERTFYEDDPQGETLKSSTNLSYLEIPVLAKLIMPIKGTIKPSLFVGPSLSIWLSGKVKYEYNGRSGEEDIETHKDTDFGLIIGAGIDFGFFREGEIIVDLRYVLGLTKIVEEEDIKNRVISLLVGYSF